MTKQATPFCSGFLEAFCLLATFLLIDWEDNPRGEIMKKTKIRRKIILKFITGLSMLCLFTVAAFPVMVGNHLEYAFEECSSTCVSKTSSLTSSLPYNSKVRQEVATAAVYLLAAKARFDDALALVEAYCMQVDTKSLPGPDISFMCGLQKYSVDIICNRLSCVMLNLEEAQLIYARLANSSRLYQYNNGMILCLQGFPYNEFFEDTVETPTLLDELTYSKVGDLLKGENNVFGVYAHFAKQIVILKGRIECIQKQIGCPSETKLAAAIDAQLLLDPGAPQSLIAAKKVNRIIHNFWNINYEFSWIHMFGQHVSEVFAHFRDNWDAIDPTPTDPTKRVWCIKKKEYDCEIL